MKNPEEKRTAAQRVRVLVCDVDGVLTDGTISLDVDGRESKGFNVLDGTGLRLIQHCGIRIGLLSGRNSEVVTRRAEDLGVDFFHHGMIHKRPVFEEALKNLSIEAGKSIGADEACYIGDDLIDLPCMRLCGFPVAVADAHPEVKKAAAYITRARGGRGAVRETVELLLRATGHWESVLERFFS